MARQQARRRNRERLTGIILACLGVVVLVVAAIALTAPDSERTATSRSAAATTSGGPASTAAPSSTDAASSPTASPKPTTSGRSSSSSTSDAKKLPLVVLNNTTTNGLATDAARTFREGGWKVDNIDNLSNEIISTCAYYDPGVAGAEAAAKALQNQFPAIKRVTEKFPELPSGPIVVVLTSDYSTG